MDMIEKVARAICDKMGVNPDDIREQMLSGSYQTDGTEPHWKGYIDHAGAAIEAMQLPPPEFFEDVRRQMQHSSLPDAEEYWEAFMIAALRKL